MAPDGAEYVVAGNHRESANTPSGWRNCNLRTHFERLVKRAGLQPWPRLFHTLRAPRETELAKEYPLHVVTKWLGNTPRIAMIHYLQVTDSDFEKAAGGGEKSGAEGASTCGKGRQVSTQSPTGKGTYTKTCQPVPTDTIIISGEDRIRTCGGLAPSRI